MDLHDLDVAWFPIRGIPLDNYPSAFYGGSTVDRILAVYTHSLNSVYYVRIIFETWMFLQFPQLYHM
jgi:hypothetical protein